MLGYASFEGIMGELLLAIPSGWPTPPVPYERLEEEHLGVGPPEDRLLDCSLVEQAVYKHRSRLSVPKGGADS